MPTTANVAATERSPRRAWAHLAGCVVGLAVLASLLPPPAALAMAVLGDGLSGVGGGALDQAVLLVAGVAVWALLGWLLLIAACAGVTRIPGTVGQSGGRLLRRIAPAAAGRLLAATLGVAVLGGVTGCTLPAFAGDGEAAPTVPSISIDWPQIDASSSVLLGRDPAPEAAAPTASVIPAPDDPPADPPEADAPVPADIPTPRQAPPTSERDGAERASAPSKTAPPQTAPPQTAPPQTAPAHESAAPAHESAAPAHESAAPDSDDPATATARYAEPPAEDQAIAEPAPGTGPGVPPAPPGDGSVIVRPGDSLWRIASRHLPGATDARVDAEWRRWYAVNRVTIGADADLILPGQVLQMPDEGDPS